MTSRAIHPTYDRDHYLTRAERYARAAANEPDPTVRAALEAAAEACRHAAQRSDRALLG
jgi:hypothetical protein